jgi:hypothetical protein
VLAEIARLLSASHAPRIPTTATVAVDRGESGKWSGKLSLDARDAHSERTLDAESCGAVGSAAALVLAIAVEGGMPPPVKGATLSAPAPAPAPAPPTPTSPSTPPRSQLSVSVGGVLETGTLPSLAGGAEVGVGWAYTGDGFRIRVSGAVNAYQTDVPSRVVPPDRTHPAEQGTFSLVAGSARGCASYVRGPVDVGPCMGAQVSSMSASGTGSPTSMAPGAGQVSVQNGQGNGQWWSIVAGAASSWSFTPSFALFVRGDILLALAQPDFHFDFKNVTPKPLPTVVYSVPTVAGRAVLGLEVRFF